MGIRIHKTLGYGLDDVKYDDDKWVITDPRFNDDGYFGTKYAESENCFTEEGFDQFINATIESTDDTFELSMLRTLRAKQREDSTTGRIPYNKGFTNHITFEPEFGMPNVMVFSPPLFGEKWHRYDDIIDYYEPSHSDEEGGISNGLEMLDRTIYPYETYVDCRTTPPTRIDGKLQSLFIQAKNSSEHSDHLFAMLINDMGLDSEAEARKVIRPLIPPELVTMLQYLKVFTDDKHIYELKPMLYWYWG